MSEPPLAISGTCVGTSLDVKRCYLPGIVIRSRCPECASLVKCDLGENYFMYPEVGTATPLTLVCDHCEHNFDVYCVLDVTVRAATREKK